MSNVSCSACADLREYAPEFVQNGVTENVATSLRNNTGLNPGLTVLHDNCDDLNDVNDCLVGRMPQELEAYDVCDWKEYMGKLLPNQYELFKALIADGCGVRTKLAELCEKINSIISPPLEIYGYLPAAPTGSKNKVGTASSKVTVRYDATIWPELAGIGIKYARMDVPNCAETDTEIFEWLDVAYVWTELSNVSVGDVLWSAGKDELQAATGMSDVLWWTYTASSWTWHSQVIVNDGRSMWSRLKVNKDTQRLELTVVGTSYPRGDAINGPIEIDDVSRLARHNASEAAALVEWLKSQVQ